MDVVEKDVKELVSKELENANKNNPLFHSLHEGYAVIREELEEAFEAHREAENKLVELWSYCRKDDEQNAMIRSLSLYKSAVHEAVEAIQMAAMALKFINSFNREENRNV